MLNITKAASLPGAKDFCDRFVRGSGCLRYVMGRNEYARSIGQCVEIDGYIDDYAGEEEYAGRPLLKTHEVTEGSLVVSAVMGKPVTAKRNLDRVGLENLDYFAFCAYSGLGIMMPECPCFPDFKQDFASNRNEYERIYDQLADVESKITYEAIINFRLTSDIEHMRNFSDRRNKQYFEPMLRLKEEGEVFVDGGGYDGETTMEFIKRCPRYAAIHFFEPWPDNILIARSNLNAYEHIHWYTNGLSDCKRTLYMDSGTFGGSSAALSSTPSDVVVNADALDHLVAGAVSFIKMDIEGAEGEALRGCAKTIERHHPRLAVCVYHRHDDFRRIPDIVASIGRRYQIFLRHYTEGSFETVMYFVPDQTR